MHIEIRHSACGKTAVVFVGSALPQIGDAVMAHDFQHIDGSAVIGNEPMVCDSCGGDFGETDMESSLNLQESWKRKRS